MNPPSALTFPVARTCPFAPPAEYKRMRDEEPISRVALPTGQSVWAFTRHQDILTMLSDPRFSSDRAAPGFPLLSEGQERLVGRLRRSVISMDPPEHGPARRAVVGEFTVRRTRAMQPRIQEIVDHALRDLLAGPRPADLVRTVSLPVPSLVICELLGVPYADHDFFQARSSLLLSSVAPVDERLTAQSQLRDFLSDLITAKEQALPDDLLGRQITKRRENGDYDHEDLLSLAFTLLVAGHETTANMISLGTLALLEHPEHLAALRADPAGTPGAVEELLRTFTIAEFAASRAATADIEIGGVVIRAGEGVMGLANSANHDPDVFPDPDTLDIARSARNHIAFGYGAHQCLGQNLARLELQIVFDTLLRRVPTLRLAAPITELPFKDDSNIYGLHQLPVTW